MCSIARKSVRASVPGAERLAARGHAHEHVCERAVCPRQLIVLATLMKGIFFQLALYRVTDTATLVEGVRSEM